MVLLLSLAGPGLPCPGCWKAGNPWQSAQDPGGMQLESLRKHFSGSRFDQPIRVERPLGEERLAHPPVRREEPPTDTIPSPVPKTEKVTAGGGKKSRK